MKIKAFFSRTVLRRRARPALAIATRDELGEAELEIVIGGLARAWVPDAAQRGLREPKRVDFDDDTADVSRALPSGS